MVLDGLDEQTVGYCPLGSLEDCLGWFVCAKAEGKEQGKISEPR